MSARPVLLAVSVALPDHWYEIPLVAADRHTQIARLVNERVGADPALRGLRRDLAAELGRIAEIAAAGGAVLCASMSLSIASEVIGANLTVTIGDLDPGELPEPGGLHRWAERCGGELISLPRVGTVVRRRTTAELRVPGIDGPIGILSVLYAVPLTASPGSAAMLQFSSPSTAYTEPLHAMFDMIASSLVVRPEL